MPTRTSQELLTTPLSTWHKQYKAKLVPFAGWEMPVQYTGILNEHKHTRSRASLFDICHMGELFITGPQAETFLGGLVTHNLPALVPGQCGYGFILNQEGGVLDDLLIYRLEKDAFMLVVNGACIDKDVQWLDSYLPGTGVTLKDRSHTTGKIDLQGPLSRDVLASVIPGAWNELGYFRFTRVVLDEIPLLVSRTGYTGELGYELYMDADAASGVWERFLKHPDVEPAGLGARDTLRLEMGLPLYGQDLDAHHTPVEAGCGFFLKSHTDYIGKKHQDRVKERLTPLIIPGRRAARHNDEVFLPDGTLAGRITSGSFAPSLGTSIALAYINARYADAEHFEIRGRAVLKAEKTTTPFYTKGTARIKL